MNKLDCGHHSEQGTRVCTHALSHDVSDGGVKRFTGCGAMAEFLCDECEKQKNCEYKTACENCRTDIEDLTWWKVRGSPGIARDPQAFTFTRRVIQLDVFSDAKILAYAALKNKSTDALFFTSEGHLYSVDIIKSCHRHIGHYDEKIINPAGDISLKISNDNRLASITSCVTDREVEHSNFGVVIDVDSGNVLMDLNNGDYHTEETEFPVAFIEHQGETCVIHATDWNRLDVTNPLTGACFTQRDYGDMPDSTKESNAVFTDWNGELVVSPDQRTIATIGWIWHPIGAAYSWNIQEWLNGSIWESECGVSKKSYASWDYFWFSPFLWLDNHRLCIWGYDELHTEHDIPLASAAIYDTETSKLLSWFAGPTMDLFVYDEYLFSGNETSDGLTVWSVDEGTLLHEEKRISASDYHPETKEFLSFKENGVIELVHWQKENG